MLRGALVGFGNVAEFGHWPGYRENDAVELVAVVDASPARRARAQEHSLAAYASLAEIPEGTIDFVDICTPPAQHARADAGGACARLARAL